MAQMKKRFSGHDHKVKLSSTSQAMIEMSRLSASIISPPVQTGPTHAQLAERAGVCEASLQRALRILSTWCASLAIAGLILAILSVRHPPHPPHTYTHTHTLTPLQLTPNSTR